jgi:hypothetical protein
MALRSYDPRIPSPEFEIDRLRYPSLVPRIQVLSEPDVASGLFHTISAGLARAAFGGGEAPKLPSVRAPAHRFLALREPARSC